MGECALQSVRDFALGDERERERERDEKMSGIAESDSSKVQDHLSLCASLSSHQSAALDERMSRNFLVPCHPFHSAVPITHILLLLQSLLFPFCSYIHCFLSPSLFTALLRRLCCRIQCMQRQGERPSFRLINGWQSSLHLLFKFDQKPSSCLISLLQQVSRFTLSGIRLQAARMKRESKRIERR